MCPHGMQAQALPDGNSAGSREVDTVAAAELVVVDLVEVLLGPFPVELGPGSR